MRKMLVLSMSLLAASMLGCGGKSSIPPPQVIVQPPKYCPRPAPPTLTPATSEGRVLTPVLLYDAKLIEKWALEMQATIDCYEGGETITDKKREE